MVLAEAQTGLCGTREQPSLVLT